MRTQAEIRRAIAAVMDGSVPHTRGRVVTEWPIVRDAPLVRSVLGSSRVGDDGRLTDPEAAWMAVAALRWADAHNALIPSLIAILSRGLWRAEEVALIFEALGPDAAEPCRAAVDEVWCPGDVAGIDQALSALEWVTR
jgi:hypothetical protein